MKKLFCLPIVAMVMAMLSGCLDNGSPADPPSGFTATAGDGRVKLEWIPSPGVDYWLFTATDPSLTAFNWTGLPNAHAYISVATPFYMCGLFSGTPYYFAVNGRKDGGPGGASSPTISATPYDASAAWTLNPTSLIQNIYGVGYASLTTCSNNATSAAGSFAAVGQGGAIFTSSDGQSWIPPTTPLSGFSSDLYAVAGYAASLNNPGTLRWVAVGAGGASVYSADGGATWTAGNSSILTAQPLRSVTQSAGTFVAVGDAGTILSSTDGVTWNARTSGTVANLNGIAHGTGYVAVGDSSTILTSSDGNTWTTPTSWTPSLPFPALRKVTAFGSIIVAVGDSGTIVTSKDAGSTWVAQNLTGSPNLVGVAAEPHLVANDIVDSWLGVVPSIQFVAIDSSGNTYTTSSSATSTNGLTWSAAISTGISTNALVSSGFGYVAVGNSGATAHAF
ncbi:MAG: WD40/YVTN/BNR-like repeat-containing protein [Pseudomonadota bacterium]